MGLPASPSSARLLTASSPAAPACYSPACPTSSPTCSTTHCLTLPRLGGYGLPAAALPPTRALPSTHLFLSAPPPSSLPLSRRPSTVCAPSSRAMRMCPPRHSPPSLDRTISARAVASCLRTASPPLSVPGGCPPQPPPSASSSPMPSALSARGPSTLPALLSHPWPPCAHPSLSSARASGRMGSFPPSPPADLTTLSSSTPPAISPRAPYFEDSACACAIRYSSPLYASPTPDAPRRPSAAGWTSTPSAPSSISSAPTHALPSGTSRDGT